MLARSLLVSATLKVAMAEEGFYMRFGDKGWVGYADFEDHQITKRKFFDESHDYHEIRVEPGAPRTIAHTKMNWIAHSSTSRASPPTTPRTTTRISTRAGGGARIDLIPVFGILFRMIRSFGDKRTEALFRDGFVREFQGVARPAKRKLEAVNAANRLDDLTVPPSNRLEKLKGGFKDFHAIRINDQWRVVFRWIDGDAHEVRIMDYH